MMKHVIVVLLLLMLSCSKKEKECPDCGDNGYCMDGECMCTEGYTGARCDEEATPLFVNINLVTLVNYPTLNNGTPWDDFSQYADPYVVISYAQNGLPIFTGEVKDEIAPQVGTIWFPSVDVSSLSPIRIQIFDFDSNANDSVIFDTVLSPYIKGENFPVNKRLYYQNATVDLLFTYKF